MTAQPAYPDRVDHLPRFLERPLPVRRDLTVSDLEAFPEDPFWDYALIDGTLIVSSAERILTREDLESFPDHPFWTFELIEGSLLATRNAPTERHQDCVFSLAILLKQACPADLKAMVAPYEVSPIPTTSVQPDVLIARRPAGPQFLAQPPVLVAEVLSPSSRWRDEVKKRDAYAKLGIQHYWIIDPAGPNIQALRLQDGQYQEGVAAGPGENFAVQEPVVVQFDPADLIDD